MSLTFVSTVGRSGRERSLRDMGKNVLHWSAYKHSTCWLWAEGVYLVNEELLKVG